MKSLRMKKFKLISVLALCFAFFSCLGGAVISFDTAAAENADTSVSEFYLPKTPLEYNELLYPVDVYSDENVTAIAQKDKLIIYVDGKPLDTSVVSFTTLKQIKKLDDSTLLILDSAIVKKVDLSTGKVSELKDSKGETVSGNYIDINTDYLVTAFGSDGIVYKNNNGTFTKQTSQTSRFSVKNDLPIAINANNVVFFVDETGLCSAPVSSPKDKKTVYDCNPNKMIANESFIYFIDGLQLCKIDISSGVKTDLTFSNVDDSYTLGCKISAPTSLAFRGSNLLLTDASSVQEFSIKDDELTFTGFAVATNRTAYNRIGSTASEVEKYGDTVAVLDNFKFMIFHNDDENYYARKNFDNYLAFDFGGELPSSFALGKTKVLLSFKENTPLSSYAVLDIKTKQLVNEKSEIFGGNNIKDVCYQSGCFYMLVANSSNSVVYSMAEDSVTPTKMESISAGNSFSKISVDVFGNVFLANDTTISKYAKANNYQRSTVTTVNGCKKMINDLSGRLFILTNSGISYVKDGFVKSAYTPNNTSSITSFAMDFISEKVFCIYEGEELIVSLESISNVAIDSIKKSDNFITSGENANFNDLKFATVKKDANVYLVKENGDGFNFVNLATPLAEYIFICDLKVSEEFTVCALASKEGIILTDKTQTTLKTPTDSPAPSTVYTTTGVNLYFVPLIAGYKDFSLIDDEKGVRLDKGVAISPEKTFTFLENDYYFASATVNGKTYKGYVPVAFTVETLYEHFKWDDFQFETVSATTCYEDETLTSALFELTEDSQVKVISVKDGVAQIMVEIDGTKKVAFIQESAIKTPETEIVKTVIIILAVLTSAFFTGLYFLLKKKKNL